MRGIVRKSVFVMALVLGFSLMVRRGEAGETTRVRANAFPGVSTLAIHAAQAQGFYAKRGLEVELQLTPNSQAPREGLAQRRFEFAYTGVDNAVALVDVAKVDAIIVMGGDSGMNQLFAQPEIQSYAALRGKTVIVDAPNTAFALLLYKMLQLNGLQKGDYVVKPVGGTSVRFEALRKDKSNAASMLNPPFTVLAEKEGFRSLGLAVRAVGPYQGPGVAVLRSWAQANADVLVRYIQAHVEALRWILSPANKDEAVKLMSQRLKLSPDVAAKTYETITDPATGFARDARFDLEGFRNTVKLRAELSGQGGAPQPPEKYFDFSYYERALAGL